MAGLASCRDGNIFDTYQQVSSKDLRLFRDRVLIRDVTDESTAGILATPEASRGKRKVRFGVIVQVGPGDDRTVKLKRDEQTWKVKLWPERAQMLCGVGDIVLYERRTQDQVYVDDGLHQLSYEEQAVLGVVSKRDNSVFPEGLLVVRIGVPGPGEYWWRGGISAKSTTESVLIVSAEPGWSIQYLFETLGFGVVKDA